jgi:hypothetical protein
VAQSTSLVSTSAPAPAKKPLTTARLAVWLFVSLVALYLSNCSLLDEGDATPNVNLPIALLTRGALSFGPEQFPEMFKWKSQAPLWESDDFYVRRWHDVVGDRTTLKWKEQGKLAFNGPRYHLVESRKRGVYVSTFGPIPGFTFLPLASIFHLFDPNFSRDPLELFTVSKLHAALLVSASAVLLFLMALAFTTRRRALLLAGAYAVGTCAWAIASQNVWQQTVNTLFICIGCMFFLRDPNRPRFAAASGAAFGAAMACRPTSAFLLIAVFVYLALQHRKSMLPLALGSLPVPALIAVYNWYYFGNPLSFGQEIVGHTTAMEKTGSPELWQTPFHWGALGLLVSPSRGLLVFSPFLVAAAAGVVKIWRDSRYRALRPLTVATLAIMAVQCKWFDWWGGWTYGYRPWVDAAPLLVLFIAPVIDAIWTRRTTLIAFGVALGWSCFVQAIGAFAYDKVWNDRMLFVVRLPNHVRPIARFTREAAERLAARSGGEYIGPSYCNVDQPYCRHRLWALDDSIIPYYIAHFGESRGRRFPTAWRQLLRH